MKFYEVSMDKKAIIVRMDRDDEVISSLESLVEKLGIESGFFYGIGAVRDVVISYFDLQSKNYIDKEMKEELEVVSLVGNISYIYGESKLVIHAHISLSDREMRLFGGHLKKAFVSVTLEVVIFTISDRIERVRDNDLGLFLWKP